MAVQERGYQPQVGLARLAAMPLASANDFGAQVGEGISQVGNSLTRLNEVERQVKADQQATDFNVKFAQARADADKASIDARNAAAPGAADHSKHMEEWWKQRSADLTAGITEPRLLRQAQAQIAEFQGRFIGSEYEYEQGVRIAKTVTDTQATSEIAANRARQSHDPKSYAEELSLGRKGIDALSVPADVKEKLVRYHDQSVTVGYINGLNDSNPKAALALIDAGAFNDILTPQQLDAARSGAQVEVRRLDAAAQHNQALQTAQLRDQVQTVRGLSRIYGKKCSRINQRTARRTWEFDRSRWLCGPQNWQLFRDFAGQFR